jgi:raffinose/stachyose/melibiose transport system permease protein
LKTVESKTMVNVDIHSRTRSRTLRWNRRLTPWLFVTPMLVLNLLVISGPTLGTLFLSFTNWTGIGSFNFIGFKNYIALLHDPTFYVALSNNIKWLIIFCIVPIAFALAVAVLVKGVKRGQMIYRTIFFLPYMLSTVLVSKIWSWLYDPFFGINTFLQKMGIKNPPFWLGDPHITLYSIALTNIWQWWGFLLVMFLTALTQLDKSLEEAALVEGASSWQIFWHVTLPQIRPTLALILMLTMIWSFAVFDYVYIMTGGGPGHASELLATYMYTEALDNQSAGYASSIAAVMGVLSLGIIGIFGILKKRGWDI